MKDSDLSFALELRWVKEVLEPLGGTAELPAWRAREIHVNFPRDGRTKKAIINCVPHMTRDAVVEAARLAMDSP